jgi:hypothetical protein
MHLALGADRRPDRAGLVILQSVLLVAGAWRNDLSIERNLGVAQCRVTVCA